MIITKAYKTELNPTKEQAQKINKTIGVCRFIYNFYLSHNLEIYEKEKRFVTGYDFSKWLNNEFLPNNPEYSWIKEVSSKAVKQSIMNGETAFKKFFNHKSKFPRFKKKSKNNTNAYFIGTIKADRHRIQIPTLSFIQLKEKGYIPKDNIKSCTISRKAGRYYISVLVNEEVEVKNNNTNDGMGIDLGIKDLAICSNKKIYKNINKTKRIKKLKKKLKREQQSLSRKYENKKKRRSYR